jgi:hypothetical protein
MPSAHETRWFHWGCAWLWGIVAGASQAAMLSQFVLGLSSIHGAGAGAKSRRGVWVFNTSHSSGGGACFGTRQSAIASTARSSRTWRLDNNKPRIAKKFKTAGYEDDC